jgi:hypothetical protein
MRICFLLFSILITSSIIGFGQNAVTAIDKEAEYTRTINARAAKIVATLDLSDLQKTNHITTVIADQYRNLNLIYTERDEQLSLVGQKSEDNTEKEVELKKIESSTNDRIAELHKTFISTLSTNLSQEQVTKVKNGMTYNVLTVTYDAYVDMIPTLKNEQREQILAWLVEAREHAMDAESSEKKHWWFGKYKGRINNYLSAQGYDITKERQDWEKRKSANQSTVQ